MYSRVPLYSDSRHAAARRLVLPAALFALCLAVALAASAGATTLVVRADGSGDVPTLQAGVDCLLGIGCDPPVDSLRVEPGDYAEDVVFDFSQGVSGGPIVCPGGPDQTRVRSMLRPAGPSGSCLIDGLEVTGAVSFGGAGHGFTWMRCRFLGNVVSHGTNASPHLPLSSFDVYNHEFIDSEFRGGLHFRGAGFVQGCRFSGRGARIDLTLFSITVSDCVFEAISDTAVVAKPSDASTIGFYRCAFRSVGSGLVLDPAGFYDGDQLRVARCRFEDVENAALSYVAQAPGSSTGPWLWVDHSRFERCGAGVEVDFDRRVRLEMVADTLIDTRGVAIDVTATLHAPCLDSLLVRGGDAHGVVLRSPVMPESWPLALTRSVIEENAGDGLVIETPLSGFATSLVSGCRLAGNGGAGARVFGAATLRHNIATANVGPGLDLRVSDGAPDTVFRNTLAGNGGPGLTLAPAPGSSSPTAVVENNLITGNQGGGLMFSGSFGGGASSNDAWSNAVANYQGCDPGPNLSIDPFYCNAPASDFTVAANSVCAPNGPRGQIGALGVGCGGAIVVGEPPSVGPQLAFSGVSPNPLPAHREAMLSFTLPEALPVTLEVVDAGGRRVVRRDLGLRSAGEHRLRAELGPGLSPGIYWVRITQGGRSASTKICVLP